MPAPEFQPRKHPQLFAPLHRILDRVRCDVPEAIGLTITVHGRRYGIGSEIVSAQLSDLGGPLPDALHHEVPVLSPGLWEDDGNIVISCLLNRPATATTVAALISYERLVNAAFVTTAAEDAAGIEDMLTVLQSRGAIEQAKGAVMGCLGCDAGHAWDVLRRTSQDFNIKVRALAVALLEHISGAPAEQPIVGTPIFPDQQTRHAAEMMWAELRAPVSPAHASAPRSV